LGEIGNYSSHGEIARINLLILQHGFFQFAFFNPEVTLQHGFSFNLPILQPETDSSTWVFSQFADSSTLS
jgi:hypothetical protein